MDAHFGSRAHGDSKNKNENSHTSAAARPASTTRRTQVRCYRRRNSDEGHAKRDFHWVGKRDGRGGGEGPAATTPTRRKQAAAHLSFITISGGDETLHSPARPIAAGVRADAVQRRRIMPMQSVCAAEIHPNTAYLVYIYKTRTEYAR